MEFAPSSERSRTVASPEAAFSAPSSPPAKPALAQPIDDDEAEHRDREEANAEDIDDDEFDSDFDSSVESSVVSAPMSDEELEAKLSMGLSTLGSMSVGRTNAGALINGVQMPKGDAWISVSPGQAWGTEETIESLKHCIEKIAEKYPNTPPLYIGHLSARHGGYLSPHKSHQAGRDVDVNYYLTNDARWYTRATAKNLDLERTWDFVRTIIADTDVDMIFIDHSIQRLLKKYAIEIGEDREWVDGVFEGSPNPIIRHARGHATHLHIRFYSPLARELGRRAYPVLVKKGLVRVAPSYVTHTVKKGNTLGSIARKHKTTVAVLVEANRLRSTRIRVGQALRIPKAHSRGVAATSAPIRIPPRRLPPSR
jgi:penicillin-insensitive murein endopeptidase